jgi:hypothetical protein
MRSIAVRIVVAALLTYWACGCAVDGKPLAPPVAVGLLGSYFPEDEASAVTLGRLREDDRQLAFTLTSLSAGAETCFIHGTAEYAGYANRTASYLFRDPENGCLMEIFVRNERQLRLNADQACAGACENEVFERMYVKE